MPAPFLVTLATVVSSGLLMVTLPAPRCWQPAPPQSQIAPPPSTASAQPYHAPGGPHGTAQVAQFPAMQNFVAAPGFTATPPLLAAIERGQRDEKALTEGSAMGRMVKPEEIGKAVAFLLSDDSSAITGVDLPVDAGWLVGSHLGPYGGVRAAR